MKKILSIGYSLDRTSQEVASGRLPSQLLYGMWQLQKDEYEVKYISHSNEYKASLGSIKDIWNIISISKNLIFIPYVHPNLFFLLLTLLKFLRIIRVPVVGIFHYTIKKHVLYSTLFRQLDMAFFHSPKNMDECINLKYVRPERCKLLTWGVDIPYYDKIKVDVHSCKFISTGIENRDFSPLLKLDVELSEKVKIILPANINKEIKQFVDSNNHNNIDVEYIAQDNSLFTHLIQQSKSSMAYLIPIKEDSLNYCVGHTSMVEALALGKPILVTENSYHPIDVEKEGVGIKVRNNDFLEWEKAIRFLLDHSDVAEQMGKRARKLAEERYNINNCSIQLQMAIDSLLKK